MSIKKNIPNLITLLNLLCGVIGVICSLSLGSIGYAFLFMLLAVVFDYCDGFAARLLKAQSPIGGELDSLADVVSFGVLPSTIMFATMWNLGGGFHWYGLIPLLFVLFAAYRLARFNVEDNHSDSFVGLPAPAAALTAASLCEASLFAFPYSFLWAACGSTWFLPVISILLGILMVSRIPMISIKLGNGQKPEVHTVMKRTANLVIAFLVLVFVLYLGWHWSAAVLLIMLAYIITNLIFAIFKI